MSSDASRKARHEFRKSPPGKAGFCISGDLLGCFHPPFDQLQQRLAAAPQAFALLEIVHQCEGFARQLDEHFLATGGAKARTVESVFLGWNGGGFWHR